MNELACESCEERKPSKDLWWCSADGCHILVCSHCRCTQHSQDHGSFFSPFSDLKSVEMIYSTLKCANFKRRMVFKKKFLAMADTIWDAESPLHERIAGAFPSLDPNGESCNSADLSEERAGRLALQLIPGGAPTDVLARLEEVGPESLALILSDLLKDPAPQTAKEKTSATSAAHSKEDPSPVPSEPRLAPEPADPKPAPLTQNRPRALPATSAIPKPQGPQPLMSQPVPPPAGVPKWKDKLLVIGGVGRELEMESLFPPRVLPTRLTVPVCGGFALTSRASIIRVHVFSHDRHTNQGIRFDLAKEVSEIRVSRCSGQDHRGGAGIGVRTTAGQPVAFLIGGPKPGDDSLSNCERLEGGVWRPVPRMSVQRSHFALVELGGFLYALGGTMTTAPSWTADVHLKSVERLSIDEPDKGWSKMNAFPDLPLRLHGHAGAAFEGRLFVVGGVTPDTWSHGEPNKPTKACFFAEPGFGWDKWTTGPSLNFARFGHGLVVANGRLYAVGGEGPDAVVPFSIEMLNSSRTKWVLLPAKTKLPMIRSAFAVI